ncbi:VQ motif-containing protein 22-like [Aristolochia californica]|uniref:VQ motif-containing protein 22-like n=1 Tax=Aristolochia californica TaxID=171875 RepID=UPI0035D8F552
MAMSETPSKPIDWTQYYHLSSGQVVAPPSSAVAESIVVTTTATTATANSSMGSGGSYSHIEGRVGKSSRRRSRASRRAPTTLLNTDTTNFRAMVQQFTGVPSVPFSSGYQSGGGGGMNFGFGAQHRQQTLVAPAPPDYYPRHHLHHHQQQQQRQQQEGAMFSLGHGNESFQPVFTNPRSTSEISEDFLGILSSSSSSQLLPRQTPGQNNDNSSNHRYIL